MNAGTSINAGTSRPPRKSWLLDGATGWRTEARESVTVGARSGIRLAAAADGPLAPTSADGSLGGLRLPADGVGVLQWRVSRLLAGESVRINICYDTFRSFER